MDYLPVRCVWLGSKCSVGVDVVLVLSDVDVVSVLSGVFFPSVFFFFFFFSAPISPRLR